MRIQGYETNLFYTCKSCKQAINKRATGITINLLKMKLCLQCYESSLEKIIRDEINTSQKVQKVLNKTIMVTCPDCNGSGMAHKRSGGNTVIAMCSRCKGHGDVESTIKETLHRRVLQKLR